MISTLKKNRCHHNHATQARKLDENTIFAGRTQTSQAPSSPSWVRRLRRKRQVISYRRWVERERRGHASMLACVT